MKIVIHAHYGGFSITREAAEFMAARGNIRAKKELEDSVRIRRVNVGPAIFRKELEEKEFFGYGYVDGMEGGYDRSDPDLVAAVETLGDKAGENLRIVEVPINVKWQIEEYDGWEWVAEQHRTWR